MPTRRTFLLAGLAGSAALVTAWWLRGTQDAPGASAARGSLAALDPEAPAIMTAIVTAMLDGALPDAPAARVQAIDTTMANVTRAIAGLPPTAQKELAQLFSLLAFAPSRVALARVRPSWREATPEEVTAFLDRWRTSHWKLLRSAYDAFHQLVYAAWYGSPRSWAAIGYAGPPALG